MRLIRALFERMIQVNVEILHVLEIASLLISYLKPINLLMKILKNLFKKDN